MHGWFARLFRAGRIRAASATGLPEDSPPQTAGSKPMRSPTARHDNAATPTNLRGVLQRYMPPYANACYFLPPSAPVPSPAIARSWSGPLSLRQPPSAAKG